MALLYVGQFTIPGSHGGLYQIYYDTNNNSGVVQYSGPYVAQSSVNLADASWNTGIVYTEGQFIRYLCSNNPATTRVDFYAKSSSPFISFTLTPNATECEIPPGPTCDIVVSSINVTPETATGANDGTATVNASTSATGLQYSLNNVTFQSSNLFTGLTPGNYTVTVKDANNCVASQLFTILAYNNPVTNFNDGLPIVTLPGGNISKWSAAFNPIVFTYQRKDFLITSITQSGCYFSFYIEVLLQQVYV